MASTTHIFLSHLKVLPHNMANAYINYYIVFTFYAFWMQLHILFNWIVPSVVLNEPNTSLKYSIMIFRLDCDGHSIKFDNYGIAYQYARQLLNFGSFESNEWTDKLAMWLSHWRVMSVWVCVSLISNLLNNVITEQSFFSSSKFVFSWGFVKKLASS